ncbi:MAG: hypothetical protein IJL88_08905 [Clostridia bacterium]|nr:hypothetical protein [Clostridia bacterium]
MKLTDLKKKTADKQAEELRRMLTEAYKAVPAGKREELDRVLFPEENAEDLTEKVIQQAEYFVECVDENLYFRPNRVVSAKERSNWRFTAGKLIRELTAVKAEDPLYQEASLALAKIYGALLSGHVWHKFASDRPFDSLRIDRKQLLYTIAERLLSGNVTKECFLLLLDQLAKNFVWENHLMYILSKCVEGREEKLATAAWASERMKGKPVAKGWDVITDPRKGYLVYCVFAYAQAGEMEKAYTLYMNDPAESDKGKTAKYQGLMQIVVFSMDREDMQNAYEAFLRLGKKQKLKVSERTHGDYLERAGLLSGEETEGLTFPDTP